MACTKIIAAGLHLVSWHADPGFNNMNPGAYFELDCGVVAGMFYNSEERATVYGAFVFDTELGLVQPTLALGVATGYEYAPVVPLISPGVGLRLTDRVTARLAYLPKLTGGMTHTLHAAVELRF